MSPTINLNVDGMKKKQQEQQHKRKLTPLTLSESKRRTRVPPEMLIEGLLKKKGYHLATGKREAGKTTSARLMAACLTRGKDFGPWRVTQPCTVLFVDAESDPSEADSEFEALGADMERLYVLYLEDVYDDDMDFDLGKDVGRKMLLETIKEYKPDVTILDNVASLAGYEHETDPVKWEPLKKLFLYIRTGLKSCIYVLAHEGKADGKGSRGHSAIEDNTDGIIRISLIDQDSRDIHIERDKLRAPKRAKVGQFSFDGLTVRWRDNPVAFTPKLTDQQRELLNLTKRFLIEAEGKSDIWAIAKKCFRFEQTYNSEKSTYKAIKALADKMGTGISFNMNSKELALDL